MANIHTPQGFRASFLSTQTGGGIPRVGAFPDFVSEPNIDFPDFISISNCKMQVYQDTWNGKVVLFYSDNTAVPKIPEADLVAFKSAKTITLTSRKTIPGTTPISYNIVLIEESLLKLATTYTNLMPTGGQQIFDAFQDNNIDTMISALKTAAITTIDPYIATGVLSCFQYPTDPSGRLFMGGDDLTKIRDYIKKSYEDEFEKKFPKKTPGISPPAPALKTTFFDNIAKFVEKANEYCGAFHFLLDDRGRSIAKKKVVERTQVSIPEKTITFRTPKQYPFVNPAAFKAFLTQMADQIKKIRSNSIDALPKPGYAVLFPAFRGGALTDQFNNAPLYDNYFQNKVAELKSHNKDLTENSKLKIEEVINEIAYRENYLKTVNDAIEVILRNNNYDVEKVNGLKAYKDLEAERTKVIDVLNKSNIKIADLLLTIP
jgi:hypothetical protein